MNSDPAIERMSAFPACLTLRLPEAGPSPLVVSSPHSGRDYPPSFVAEARLDRLALRRSEDSFVDELFGSAPAHGAWLLSAKFPRAYCDANREAWELDPTMFEDALPAWVNTSSPRVGAGLGTIARVVANGEAIYRAKLTFAEAERRVRACWQPYHDTLSGLLEGARGRFGACVLLDCHSMPSHACTTRVPVPDIVLGDAHGTSCAPGLVRRVEQMLTGRGYTVRRNDPYAGGFVTRHYGKPRGGVHAVQVEIARNLYMHEQSMERTDGFARVAADMGDLAKLLAGEAGALAAAA